jgi:hypothetical protein
VSIVVLATIPNPPSDMVTPATTDAIMSTLSISLALAAVLYAIFLWWRDRSPVPFLIVLGAGTAAPR